MRYPKLAHKLNEKGFKLEFAEIKIALMCHIRGQKQVHLGGRHKKKGKANMWLMM